MSKTTASDKNFEPQSPDELDRSIKVTRPSVWMALALCLVVLAIAFVWAVFGRVETTVNGYAMCTSNLEQTGETVFMFVTSDEQKKLSVGNPVVVNGVKLEVGIVSDLPLSQEEMASQNLISSDYLRDVLFAQEWGYYVGFVKPGNAEKIKQLYASTAVDDANEENLEALSVYTDVKEYGFAQEEPLSATIVTRSIAPITLVFG